MAGHSKWANTKHRKARVDAKRGKIFSKIAKELMVAARDGGGDPDANPRLRSASAAAFNRICTWRSAPPQTSTLDTPGTVSMRVRTLSETKSRIMSMSRPRGLPSSGATRKYMNELLENDSA